MELIINSQFTTVFTGPADITPTDVALYINGMQAGETVITNQMSPTVWSISFTPVSSGIYTFVAFGAIQFRARAVTKSMYDFLTNIEDEALGSWSWNKTSGLLTIYRQNGTILAIHNVVDNLDTSSRERVN